MPIRLRLALSCSVLFLCACSTSHKLDRPSRADSVRDAGSVHFSVLSVAPWHHYVAALQPNFQLSADDALGIVVLDSRRGEESALSALSVSSSLSQNAGDPNDIPNSAPDVDDSKFKASGPLGLELSGGGDAMLRYAAATSLYQEVQLLNRYVRDAAIPTGFRAYVVRLQITLMPRRRHQPYDTCSTVSFFTANGSPDGDSGSDLASRSGASSQVAIPGTTLRGSDDMLTSASEVQAPRVLPLLVSDNLESSLESKSSQVIRALRLSLTGLWEQSGANLGSSGLSSGSTDDVTGRDLNSLLTVARLSENTLRIRLGAVQSATTDDAMVPRNHNRTLLLMVPDSAAPMIQVVAKTELVDTQNGQELVGTSERQIRDLYRDVQRSYGIDALNQKVLTALLQDAQQNDQVAFSTRLRAAIGDREDSIARSLWIDLISLMAGSQFTASRFELPGHGASGVETTETFYQQTAVVLDDNQQRSVVVLRGARSSESASVEVVLQINSDGRDIPLPAESIALDGPKREIRMTFPSLARLGLDEAASQSSGRALTLDLDGDLIDFDAFYLRQLQ